VGIWLGALPLIVVTRFALLALPNLLAYFELKDQSAALSDFFSTSAYVDAHGVYAATVCSELCTPTSTTVE
jgi:hypothetical protein